MANWADRILAVVNTFTGRPSPTDLSAAFQVRAAPVNANFQKGMLAVAFCQALGTECADDASTAILCKLKLPAGRCSPGDRLTIIEDRPTLRTWCKVVTGTAAVPLVEFADANLQDLTLAGTADYDTIKDDLILLQVGPLDKASWPKQSILLGGEHGLTGDDLPWQYGETDTVADKLNAAVGPAGSDTQVQFNDGGNMGADPGLAFEKTGNNVKLGDGGHTMTGFNSLAVGGSHVMASDAGGPGGSLAVGYQCETAAGASCSLVSGFQAKAKVPFSRAHSSGYITASGDNQYGRVPAGIQTTDAAAHILYSLPLTAGTSYTVRGMVNARTAAGVVSGWTFVGVVERAGATSRDIAAIVPTQIADPAAAFWTCAVAANVATDTLDITVQCPAGATINWGLTLEWEEVTL